MVGKQANEIESTFRKKYEALNFFTININGEKLLRMTYSSKDEIIQSWQKIKIDKSNYISSLFKFFLVILTIVTIIIKWGAGGIDENENFK